MCVRVCARACVVQRGVWLVGCVACSLAPQSHGTGPTSACVSFRGVGVGAGAWLFSRFSSSQKIHLIWGSRCHLSIGFWGPHQFSSVQFSSVHTMVVEPLAVIRNRRLNGVALLAPLRSVQFSSVPLSSCCHSPELN